MLSGYGKNQWRAILLGGVALTLAFAACGWAMTALVAGALTLAMLSFFRDPHRRIPSQRGVVVAPADGRISSIHELEYFEPFDDSAVCIRIFLSVFNVHVNRSPCHGQVASILHKDGCHLNALNPQSAEDNESNLIVLVHPVKRHPVAAVRQVAGLIARSIACGLQPQQVVRRGDRIGMIKFGSTTELYLPRALCPDISVIQGQKVKGGATVLATVSRTMVVDFDEGSDACNLEANNRSSGSKPTHPC